MTHLDDAGRSSRDKILIAAATMIGEDPASRLSVRAVAARAGVNTGSLRHHFPTQRELYDTVLSGIYDLMAPGDPIRDTARAPADRLAECLRTVLALTGLGGHARETWRTTYLAFIAAEPSEDTRGAFLALERAAQKRIESWLDVLAEEGALPAGDNARRARFLNTVLDGLSIERALPADESRLAFETETLRAAVDSIFTTRDGSASFRAPHY